MRLKGFFLTVVAILAYTITAFAQQVPPVVTSNKPLPFYFPQGVQTTTDPILQRQEYLRYLISGWACNQGNKNGIEELIAEPGSVSVETKIISTDSVTKSPVAMRIVLDHFVAMPDGRIRVTTLCN